MGNFTPSGPAWPRFGFCALCLALLLLPVSAQAAGLRAYIGSYTPEPTARQANHGEGIYLVDIDPRTGAPGHLRLAARMLSPSWLALSPDHRFLYADSEILQYGGEKTGSVTAFAIDPASGALRLLNVVSSQGAGPAYISVHPSGKFVLVANYYGGNFPTGGSFSVIRLNADGSLGAVTDTVRPDGPPDAPMPAPPGNGTSRGHMIGFDRSGQYVIGDDVGRGQIFVWTLDLETGKLSEVSRTDTYPGAGPRHFVFSPDNKVLYQALERDAKLGSYDFDKGRLTEKQKPISAVPDAFAGRNSASELLISRDGRRLYSGNRNQDTIALYAVGARGLVRRLVNVPTETSTPRSLAIDPSGRFLYSMNQRGENVTTFRIDPKTGVPRFTGHYLAVGSPAVMVFLPG